ncbi:MAG: transporter [Patescibacteria group bacterium]|nr:transporter [Patescibacteria group bacterium]
MLNMPFLGNTPKVELNTNRNYWSMVRELAVTDFKLKYQGSVFGYLWSLMKPLAIFGVLYLVFSVFVRIGSDIPNYPVYLLLGIVLWNYFAESTNNAMRSIVDKGDLIRKVYFPRIVILFSNSLSALITLVLNLLIIVVFMLVARIFPTPLEILGFLVLTAELYLLSLGISLFLAALYVKFRDFAYIWEVALQLLFYASAIIFPLNIVPHRFLQVLTLSPITQIIQDTRKLLISPATITTFDSVHSVLRFVPYAIPILLVVLGYWYFERAASHFAEDV